MNVGTALTARYDRALLRVAPPTPLGVVNVAATAAAHAELWSTLEGWCFDGESFAVATLAGADRLAAARLAEAFSRRIDGSLLLAAAAGPLARLRIRLQVKLADALGRGIDRPAHPWDSGYLADDAPARAALTRFVPRRATLIVCSNLAPQLVADASAALRANVARLRHPVRLLVLANAPGALRFSATSPCAGSR